MSAQEASSQGSASSASPGRNRFLMFESLQDVAFRMLWLGTFFSTAAIQIDMVAKSWLAYDLTGSAAILGLVAGARAVPMLLLSLVGGVVADRVRKRNLIVASQFCLGLSALTVAILVHTGLIQVWHLAAVGAVQGILFSFNMPARQALVPELVGKRLLSNAIAMQSMGMNVNRIVAPAVAGLLISLGPNLAFYTTSLLYAGSVMTLLTLPAGKPVDNGGKSAWAALTGGFQYIWGNTLVRTLLLMAFVPTFLGMPFMQLLPVFQADVFQVGPSQLGVMYTAVGVGSLLSSLGVAGLSSHPRLRMMQMFAGAGFGMFLVAFALAPSFAMSLVLLFAVGFFSQGYFIINHILLMTNVERELFGRVSSIGLITWSLNPIALVGLGIIVDAVGAPPVVAGQGVVLFLFMVAVVMIYPALGRPLVKEQEIPRVQV